MQEVPPSLNSLDNSSLTSSEVDRLFVILMNGVHKAIAHVFKDSFMSSTVQNKQIDLIVKKYSQTLVQHLNAGASNIILEGWTNNIVKNFEFRWSTFQDNFYDETIMNEIVERPYVDIYIKYLRPLSEKIDLNSNLSPALPSTSPVQKV